LGLVIPGTGKAMLCIMAAFKDTKSRMTRMNQIPT
jgi:hypothetical protein